MEILQVLSFYKNRSAVTLRCASSFLKWICFKPWLFLSDSVNPSIWPECLKSLSPQLSAIQFIFNSIQRITPPPHPRPNCLALIQGATPLQTPTLHYCLRWKQQLCNNFVTTAEQENGPVSKAASSEEDEALSPYSYLQNTQLVAAENI